jgi:exosome complex component RRP41
MSKELVSPEGLRTDGRRIGELRHVKIELNPIKDVDGSCIFSMGNTQVLAVVSGPNDKLRMKDPSQSTLIVEYGIAPFAYSEHRTHVSSHPLPGQIPNNATKEYALLLEKTFSNTILLQKWPNSVITLSITVLSDQGSALAAAINASTAALIIAGIDMNDVITATSSGLYDGKPLLDVTQIESSSLGGSTTLAIFNNTGQIGSDDLLGFSQSGSVLHDVEGALDRSSKMKKIAAVHHTQRMHLGQLELSFAACIQACGIVHDSIKESVREYIQMYDN